MNRRPVYRDLDPRRALDGDGFLEGIKDTLSDITSSVGDAFTGTTADEVASGEVDLASLSREDRAQLVIDGQVSGLFSPGNPWRVGKDFDESVTAFAHAHGGVVLVIACEARFTDALTGTFLAPRFALVWDDEIVSERGTLTVNFTGQTFLVVNVKDVPAGRRLTLWTTDDDLTFTLVKEADPSDAEEVRREVFGAVSEANDDGAFGQVVSTLKAFFDVQKTGFIAVIVVGVIVVYAIVKVESKGLRLGGGS